jgi:CRP/FNR family transcriptional regulator, cyclic AMP receptor protein
MSSLFLKVTVYGKICTTQCLQMLRMSMSDIKIGLIADALQSASCFDGMPRMHALEIAQHMTVRSFARGQMIMREGMSNEGRLYIVLDGEAVVSSVTSSGASVVHRRAGAGHLLGEVGFIDGAPHSAMCKAYTDMSVAYLERDTFIALLQSNPLEAAQLMAGLLKVMAHRLRHANRSIAHLAGKLHEAQAKA